MIYVYNCQRCNQSREEIRKVSERNDPVYCLGCGREMVRVPCYHGGLKTEHPAWLDHYHVEGALGRKFSTRSEHDQHCRDNGIVQRG